MRFIRKGFSLIMACVLISGICISSSFGAYKDAENIHYTEAVDVMTAIGVLQGDNDGFRPQDGLTRAEACKIISFMSGADNNTQEASFKDLTGYGWAEKYIAYCESEGIVNGVGDGNFNPGGELTGYAFCKMCLVILGYDSGAEEMYGTSWTDSVSTLAEETGITFGISGFDGSSSITREEAAQIAFNTLKTVTVSYSENTAKENTNTGLNGIFADGMMQFGEKYFTSLSLSDSGTSRIWSFNGNSIGTYGSDSVSNSSGVVTSESGIALLVKHRYATASGNGVYSVVIAKENGKTETLTVNYNGDISALDLKMVRYTKTASGATITAASQSDYINLSSVGLSNGTTQLTAAVKVNESTKFVYVNYGSGTTPDGTVNVYTGSDKIISVGPSDNIYAVSENGTAKTVYVTCKTRVMNSDGLTYVLGTYKMSSVNGRTVFIYDVIIGGDITTITLPEALSGGPAQTLYSKITSDGTKITEQTLAGDGHDSVSNVGGLLFVDGDCRDEYEIDDDTPVYIIDRSDDSVITKTFSQIKTIESENGIYITASGNSIFAIHVIQ